MASTESLSLLRELFPDWSDEDLSLVLEESRGELDTAITRISEGHATKFGEVTKKKDKAPKRVEFGNGRGRGRGASAPRGRSEFRGRGRGRGTSVSVNSSTRTATETNTSWPDSVNASSNIETLPQSATVKDATENPEPPSSSRAPEITKSETLSSQPSIPPSTNTVSKPKSKIIDKNSKSSWASIAKPIVPAEPAKIPTHKPSNVPIEALGKPAPLTEENLEVVTDAQDYVPEPPTATVASLIAEPTTAPSSTSGVTGTPAAAPGPPGLKSGFVGAARGSTPVGGRRLQQDQAVVMPGSEREPASRLGVQFGSLGLHEDEPAGEHIESAPQKQDVRELPSEIQARQEAPASRVEKPYDNFGGAYGAYGMPSQQTHPAYAAQNDHYSNFYGHSEAARPAAFGGQNDYYQAQSNQSQHSYGGSAAAVSQRSESTARQTEPSSRFGESGGSPMTSLSSQQGLPPHSSPAPSHLSGPQHGQFPMHPQQYGQPNPYAYYGYGYGYPQQQSAYAPMYGQRGYGGQSQFPTPHVHQSAGTSQDRFERSTAEYQRQQQVTQPSQGSFGATDFLGSGRNHQQSAVDLADPFKGFSGASGPASQRDESKQQSSGFAGQAQGFSGQGSQGQYGSQQHQPAHQSSGSHYEASLGQGQSQGQYAQYGGSAAGGYGRAGQQQHQQPHQQQQQQPQQQQQQQQPHQQYSNWNQGY